MATVLNRNPAEAVIKVPGRKGDWLYARQQWESTNKTARVIAAEIDVQDTTLISYASREGWTRDPANRTATKAAELLLANKEVHDAKRRSELAAIERVNVAMQAEVLSVHRKDIKKARDVCTQLMDKVLDATSQVTDAMTGSLEELQGKANIMLKLSSSMKNLILLERQALGISTVLQDPEETQSEQTPQDAALNLLINKFASVLQTQNTQHVAATIVDMGEVHDLAPKEQGHGITAQADKATA